MTYPASSQYNKIVEFIRISDSDISTKETAIYLENCSIRIDLYELSEGEVNLQDHLSKDSVDPLRRGNSELPIDSHETSQHEIDETQDSLPQAKVMSLPNRDLMNTWKEYSCLFLTHLNIYLPE